MTSTVKDHFMIDLETLGLRYDAAIISIGAIRFNIATGEELGSFHNNITYESALKYGKAETETVKWWSQQSKAAKAGLEDPVPRSAANVMNDFTTFLGTGCIVWGNPSVFDISKLEYWYQGNHPWNYYHVRDMYSYYELGELLGINAKNIPFEGTKHNALDDARHQVKFVSKIYQVISRI